MRRSLFSPALLCLLLSQAHPLSCFGAEGNASVEPILAEAPVTADKASVSTAPTRLSYSSCRVEGNFVALTFDDGPHPENTPRLLDMLKKAEIKATFFVVGQNAAQYPDILKRIIAEGHELANHSYTHPVLASLSEASVHEQLDKTRDAVFKATGVTMKLMRPPYGALSEPQRRTVNADFGYRIILWDVDPEDWKYRDANRVGREIVSHTHAGSIILTHDIHKSTVEAIPSTIEALTAKGFKFVTVSELLAMDKPLPPKAPVAAAPKATVKVAREEAEKVEKPEKSEKSEKQEKSKNAFSKETNVSAKTSDSSDNSGSKSNTLTQEELRRKWLGGNK